VVALLASSSAPTPLYPVYQAEWGFSAITTTIVFGVYAIAVLASLLTFGSLSDHVGRRPVLLVALLVQAVTMWVFATAGGVPQLLAARVVQGLATGAAVGAGRAGLLDLDRVRVRSPTPWRRCSAPPPGRCSVGCSCSCCRPRPGWSSSCCRSCSWPRRSGSR
jgi:MFS family permease